MKPRAGLARSRPRDRAGRPPPEPRRIARPDTFGDLCRGRVACGRIEDGVGLADLAARVEHQPGETGADGTATAEPPRAGGGAAR